MRPRQWVKNLFVFAALLFTGNLTNTQLLGRSIAAFAIFCGLSGVVYLFNDIADLQRDREHPKKKNRPIARGTLSVGTAISAAVVIGVVSLTAAVALSITRDNANLFWVVAVAYLILNLAYSFSLKGIVILDVFCIALGFVMRAAAGAVVIGVEMSQWLFLCTLLLSLFLALGKRRHELLLLEQGAVSHRAILKEYSPYFLDQMIAVVTAATVMAYAMYTFDSGKPYFTPYLWWTIPFVIYGIFRYLYLVHQRDQGGDPTSLVISDPPLLASILLWALAVWISMKAYLPPPVP